MNKFSVCKIANDIDLNELEEQWINIRNNDTIELVEKICCYKDDLEKFDKKRFEKYKVIFKKFYIIIENIGHLLPFDLQQLFDYMILVINFYIIII